MGNPGRRLTSVRESFRWEILSGVLQVGVVLAGFALGLDTFLSVLFGQLSDLHQSLDREVSTEVEDGLVGTCDVQYEFGESVALDLVNVDEHV